MTGVRRQTAAFTCLLAAAVAAAPTAVWAQALERHLPPAETAPPQSLPAPAAPEASRDRQVLGAPLKSLVILGPTTPALASPGAAGVDTAGAPRLAGAPTQAMLRRFLGRPITRQLISDIETAIVKAYRRMDHPFVEVSTPEQEVDQGTLQIRVIEFRVAAIAAPGAGAGEAKRLKQGLRLQPGDTIDSDRLQQDLDWLGRYPFRSLTPTFSPAAGLGETDLNIAVADAKPWQVTAGYEDSGSPLTGRDRYFAALTAGAPALNDAVLAVELTGSPDFWGVDDIAFGEPHPLYKALSGRFTQPTFPRQDVELTAEGVETNEVVQGFLIRQQTLEGTLGYRTALSNFVPAPGDVVLGVQAIRQSRSTFFDDQEVAFLTDDDFQLFGEWSDRWASALGQASLDLQAHGSPGDLDDRNSAASIGSFTNNRVTSATYVYGAATFAQSTRLPGHFVWSTQVNGQYAGRAIPDADQLALGGESAVRGYSVDDGAYDDGVFARNELDGPPLSIIRSRTVGVVFQPLAFVDAGYGHNEATGANVGVGSAGVGANVAVGPAVAGGVTLACPLANGPATPRGAWLLDAHITVAF